MKVFPTYLKEANIEVKRCRKKLTNAAVQMNEPFQVQSLEGLVTGKTGDYLMVGVQGELYICDKDIFEKSYEFI